MELCRECLRLRGPLGERTQRCACEPKEPLWNGYDYNTAIELCQCCAAATIPSGSRWSVFFCDACKERVVAYNRAAGCCAIPIGRHSLMNGIFVTDEDVESSLVSFFERIDRLTKWHRERVRAVVQSLPGDEAVPLDVYLERARTIANAPAWARRLLDAVRAEHPDMTDEQLIAAFGIIEALGLE